MITLEEPSLLEAGLSEGDPARTIEWAVNTVGVDQIVVATSFGPAGMVNLHMVSEIAPQVPVVFVDTLYHFDETLELADIARRRYDLDLHVYRAADSREDFERVYGERLWEHDLEKFHDLTKVKPMERALDGISGWITGRRRDQSSTRADLPLVEYNGRMKINPLVGWSREDVWAFIRDNEIPYNRLHDLGYASIGDEPLTTPTLLGEEERAGRWRGQGRLECGLHTL